VNTEAGLTSLTWPQCGRQRVEVWRDAEAMQQWRGQANAPAVKRAKYASVKRYNATDGGPVF
jgi:hypothetical protein